MFTFVWLVVSSEVYAGPGWIFDLYAGRPALWRKDTGKSAEREDHHQIALSFPFYTY